MNDFIISSMKEEMKWYNTFIQYSQALPNDSPVEIVRELTNLRIQLQSTEELAFETEMKLEALKSTLREATVFDFFLLGLFISTLVLLGIAYMFL